MIGYEVYHFFSGAGNIEARVEAAVTRFYQVRGELPAVIVVNPTEREEAQEACKALSLKVSVGATGGCLIPEVWLALPERADSPSPKGDVRPDTV